MMNFDLFDVVVLAADLPDKGLLAGMSGTVVDIHTKPCEAYEVEFCDDAGRTVAVLALLPNQLLPTASWKSKKYEV
ncbi:DUF4926 domain-containing protein [Sulfurirhabdus autotrophica]|uniref:Uncharacterized protein DUF4926 n=1 Tax=Sulfurirhabdus autotrophica TaxID=1706046 RepID=A0A4R3XP31_9PROT|nr:DUF4926 domain-containing protein [Sulfurirhabdus autotrophica]TCV77489.1 uncharacterized protein DUF4926 [Sulfurirhabdus autotrophica]